jgi:hypothetical protein
MNDFRGPNIKTILEGDFSSRIHQLSLDECSFDVANGKIKTWKDEEAFSVFSAGTYDLLTLNHVLGLMEARSLGAMALLDIASVDTMHDQEEIHSIAATSAIRLMITLDTNRALRESKSRRPDKGGSLKPILDWNTRAAMLASQSMPTSDYSSRTTMVDFITRHGPDACVVCAEGTCVNDDNAAMTMRLQPDLVVVNADSLATVTSIENYKAEGLLPKTRIAIVSESTNQYFDQILEGPVKTSAIIKRIRD